MLNYDQPCDQATASRLYLELIKKSVNNFLYLGRGVSLADYQTTSDEWYQDSKRLLPRDCCPHSILDSHQLTLTEKLVLDLDKRGVKGDLLEAGVWRGGVIILLLAIVKCFGMRRNVLAADTFGGVPYGSITGDPVNSWTDRFCAPIEEVKLNISRYELLGENLKFIVGEFGKTFLNSPIIGELAFVRIDCDSYQSTMDALVGLYDKISAGGVILIDDGHLPGCRLAAIEFRNNRDIKNRIEKMGNNIFWIK